MQIRPASHSDLPSIANIVNWAIENTYAHFHDAPEPVELWQRRYQELSARYPWLVAEDESEILGLAMGGPHKPRAAYDWTVEVTVYVDPDHHRRGVGRKLYQHLLPTLERQNFKNLVAVISLPNLASVRLHQSFGFTQYGILKQAGYKFDEWHDVSYWCRSSYGDVRPPPPLSTAEEAWGSRRENT